MENGGGGGGASVTEGGLPTATGSEVRCRLLQLLHCFSALQPSQMAGNGPLSSRCKQGPKETFGFRGFPRETFHIVVYPEDNASVTEEILCISGLEERSGWGLCSETSLSREANEEESTGWVLFRPSSIPHPFPGV